MKSFVLALAVLFAATSVSQAQYGGGRRGGGRSGAGGCASGSCSSGAMVFAPAPTTFRQIETVTVTSQPIVVWRPTTTVSSAYSSQSSSSYGSSRGGYGGQRAAGPLRRLFGRGGY